MMITSNWKLGFAVVQSFHKAEETHDPQNPTINGKSLPITLVTTLQEVFAHSKPDPSLVIEIELSKLIQQNRPHEH